MSLLDKEPVKRVQRILLEFDSSQKVLILDSSARTAKDAASSLGCEVGAIVKSLLLRADNTFVLTLIAGDKRCSLNKLKETINKRDICMANPEDVKTQTGYTIGGVSPVGHLKKLEILIDKSLERFNNLYAAAGHPNCVFKINFLKLQKITNGTIKEIID
jgi:Cys-tRNA(Pro) deacylase